MKKDFLVPLMLCVSLSCKASDYYFKPVFSANERYYSNLFLRTTFPVQDNWISTLSPGLNFGLRHENGELKANFTWNQLFYTNQTELNVSEQLFSVDYQHKTERLQWSLGSSYNNRASINTIGTVIGTVFTNIMAKQLSVAPSVSYDLDERSSLSFDYSYNKTTYEKNSNLYLTNYDYHQASGTFNHLYTERDKLNVTLSSSLYKAQLYDQSTFNHVAQLGWQHSFSEQLLTYLSVGMNYSQAEFTRQIPAYCAFEFSFVRSSCFPLRLVPASEVTTKSNGFGQVYRASIQKSFEKGSVSLVGSQNQTPTSQGLQTQTQLAINSAYTINERWSSGLSASYSIYESSGQQNNQFNINRTYYDIGPNINWKWTPEINVGFSYTYRQQDFKSSTQASYDNNMQLQITYQPQTNLQVK